MKWVITTVLVLNILYAHAQNNLIPNPSFEDIVTCNNSPDDSSETIPKTVKYWFNANHQGFQCCRRCYSGTIGPPKLLSVPNNGAGYQEPKTGNNYLLLDFGSVRGDGAITSQLDDHRSFISCRLLSPLKADSMYKVTFYLALVNNIKWIATSSVGCYFSTNKIYEETNLNLHFTPQIKNDSSNYFIDSVNWQPFEGYYLAKGGENYITIGNFDSIKDVKWISNNPVDTVYYSFVYYLDDVTLITIPISIQTNKDTMVCKGTPVAITKRDSFNCVWFDGRDDSVRTFYNGGKYWVTSFRGNTFITDTVYIHIRDSLSGLHNVSLCPGSSRRIACPDSLQYQTFLWTTLDTTPSILIFDTGTFILQSFGTCLSVDTFLVYGSKLPILKLPEDTFFCSNKKCFLDASGLNNMSYKWSTGEQTPAILVNSGGLYWVRISTDTCALTDSVLVKEFNSPVLNLPFDTAVCFEELKKILLDAGDWKSYVWYPTGEHTRTINATYPALYRVVVNDYNDCIGIDTTLVEEDCPDGIYIPNAFTPNMDGINDILFVRGTGILEIDLHIYNRWGMELFASANQMNGWDGSHEKQIVPEGVYTYRLNYKLKKNNSMHTLTGTVTLLR